MITRHVRQHWRKPNIAVVGKGIQGKAIEELVGFSDKLQGIGSQV